MNGEQLAAALRAKLPQLNQSECEEAMRLIADAILYHVFLGGGNNNGYRVEIEGFGGFRPRHRSPQVMFVGSGDWTPGAPRVRFVAPERFLLSFRATGALKALLDAQAVA